MKISIPMQSRRSPGARAFTLTELMIVAAIFTLLLLATVSSHIFGLRLYRISETKLSVTADARKTLNFVRDEIRAGKSLYVENGNGSSFTVVSEGAPHIGNSLKICATTNESSYVRYYLDPEDLCLKRVVNDSIEPDVVARHVTNVMVFRAEDYQGNVLTNTLNNRVINMTLQFNQREFALSDGSGQFLCEHYQLQTRIARRAID
jgi:prepilin-type N-terminal cleavage/methylation domain-containing protein